MGKKLGLVLVMVFLLSLPGLALASPLVRIGIINGKDSVNISGQRPFSIINTADDYVIAKGQPNEKWRIEYRGGQIYLNNKLMNEPFMFKLEPGDDNEYLIVDGRRYRGEVEIRPSVSKKGLTVIEVLPVEEYVYGIIPGEISPAWPMEAVKAQAVAARTYALYHLGKHKKDGFDLCPTTECQVYGGREAEDPRGNWAVDATKGMVVTYKNNLVPTFFHSSSGGYTENVENVWSVKTDYLRAVPDYDQNSPHFSWKTTFTTEEIGKRLESAGYSIGLLQGIKLSRLHDGINDAVDRGVSGRVKTITFIGSKQAVTISGNDVRQLFKLNSTLFDIGLTDPIGKEPATQLLTPAEAKPVLSISNTAPAVKNNKQDVPKSKINNNQQIPAGAKSNQDKPFLKPADQVGLLPAKQVLTESKLLPEAPVVHVISQPDASVIVTFEGRGSGHGLGLSQWGAKAMAEQGPKDDHTYYQQILKHYYQGVDITKWY